jgi:hypothetical protein
MSLTLDDAAVMARFDDVCTLVSPDGRGISLTQLGAAHALARELESDEPDQGKIGDHCHALGLDPAELGR